MAWAPRLDLRASESASASFILPNSISVSGRGLRLGPSFFRGVTLAVSADGVGTLGLFALLIGVVVVVKFFCGWEVMQPPHRSASGTVNSQPEMRPCIVVLASVRDMVTAFTFS